MIASGRFGCGPFMVNGLVKSQHDGCISSHAMRYRSSAKQSRHLKPKLRLLILSVSNTSTRVLHVCIIAMVVVIVAWRLKSINPHDMMASPHTAYHCDAQHRPTLEIANNNNASHSLLNIFVETYLRHPKRTFHMPACESCWHFAAVLPPSPPLRPEM